MIAEQRLIPPSPNLVAALGVDEIRAFDDSHPDAASAVFDPAMAAGKIELFHIHPSVVVAVSDFVSRGREFHTWVDKDVVKLNFQLTGGGAFSLGADRAFSVGGASACVVHQVAGMAKVERYVSGAAQRAVTLMCEVDYLREMLAETAADLPAPLSALLNGEASDFFSLGFEPNREIVSAAEAILRGRTWGLRRLEVQARAFELMYQFFRRLEALESGASGRLPLSCVDGERLEAVRLFIEQRFAEPLSMAQLAREAGTNESKLTHQFKGRFGLTVFDYLRKVRMERASFLLRETNLPVTQIALEIGYEHPANFATAFKRSFGQSPRAFRAA
ncbi:MAG: AraC family transcriptional regulator [Caulobacteraceae bacterium]|nr:AraC family transcriptional regulator [Caulobacteraceae bacterium]